MGLRSYKKEGGILKTVQLKQDWGSDINGKRAVEIPEDSLYYELEKHFRWRKGDFKERLFKLGTREFDGFIQHLIDKGYKEV
jgi:hypothetical protein